ncbi:hypothetical protein [Ramlibacter sp. AN1133]|uniref:hypothetical protein n=1 Tax=Ramlibacter sp. AN1133 TaxID=3133429 RepID=UPI0030C50213
MTKFSFFEGQNAHNALFAAAEAIKAEAAAAGKRMSTNRSLTLAAQQVFGAKNHHVAIASAKEATASGDDIVAAVARAAAPRFPDVPEEQLRDLASLQLLSKNYAEFRSAAPTLEAEYASGGHVILSEVPPQATRNLQDFDRNFEVRRAISAELVKRTFGRERVHQTDGDFLAQYLHEKLLPLVDKDDSAQLARAQIEAGGNCTQLSPQDTDFGGQDFDTTAGEPTFTAVIDFALQRPGAGGRDAAVGASALLTFPKSGECVVAVDDAEVKIKYFVLEAAPQ